MSAKQRDKSAEHVIDLTQAEYFVARPAPPSTVLLTLPDKVDVTPAPEERERDGDLGLAAALPIKRHPVRARFRGFEPLTILGIAVVLTIGALMLTLAASFRH
ncbi:MAG TPA: hypothetical protein VHE57_00260 [Mycobacteriales bacterium]|nr:hypothetical protein [Mycobacteriales bacterium]